MQWGFVRVEATPFLCNGPCHAKYKQGGWLCAIWLTDYGWGVEDLDDEDNDIMDENEDDDGWGVTTDTPSLAERDSKKPQVRSAGFMQINCFQIDYRWVLLWNIDEVIYLQPLGTELSSANGTFRVNANQRAFKCWKHITKLEGTAKKCFLQKVSHVSWLLWADSHSWTLLDKCYLHGTCCHMPILVTAAERAESAPWWYRGAVERHSRTPKSALPYI